MWRVVFDGTENERIVSSIFVKHFEITKHDYRIKPRKFEKKILIFRFHDFFIGIVNQMQEIEYISS